MNCVYCNSSIADSRDHVPPKTLLRKPYPPNLWTVPSCVACNNSFSLDEEYFRNMAIGMFCHSPEADQLFDGPVSRSFDRRNHLEDAFWSTLDVDGERPHVEIQQGRIDRVALKIIAGLHYIAHNSEIDTPIETILFREVDNSANVPNSLSDIKFDKTFAPDFTFRNNTNDWQLVFFDSFECLAQFSRTNNKRGITM